MALSCSDWHSVGLREDGSAVATDNNRCGQCAVENWRSLTAIAAGCIHTVGLRSDGRVVATEANASETSDVGQWEGIVALDAGSHRTLALSLFGRVSQLATIATTSVMSEAGRTSSQSQPAPDIRSACAPMAPSSARETAVTAGEKSHPGRIFAALRWTRSTKTDRPELD